jgi:anti-sigma regulatory factor (Ser/Thr protein kinase)
LNESDGFDPRRPEVQALQTAQWRITVPHHAQGARVARHRLTASLTGLLPASALSDVVAVTAELVGNAVRHAAPLPGGVVRVAWQVIRTGLIEIRVTDGGAATPPAPRVADPEAPDGRGLAIVAALSDHWGVDRMGPAQCVWARIAIPTTRRPAPTLAGARV